MSSENNTLGRLLAFALHGLAAIIGLTVAFVLAPLIYAAGHDAVFAYAQERYWDWLAYPATWVLFLVSFVGVLLAGHLLTLGLVAAGTILYARLSTRGF